MNQFCITLEARDPERNIYRNYEVAAGRDLLDDWIVDLTFGRIGSWGRTIRQAYPDEDAARRRVLECLRRRRSAPRRLGVRYEIKRLVDQSGWLSEPGFGEDRMPLPWSNV